MLLQEEHQREMSSEVHMIPQSTALYNTVNSNQDSLGLTSNNAGYNNFGSKNSYSGNLNENNSYPNSGSYSHNPSNEGNNFSHNGNNNYLPPRGTVARRQLFCDHCKITGHTAQKCYKLHGYPLGHRLYKGKRVAASVAQEQDGVS